MSILTITPEIRPVSQKFSFDRRFPACTVATLCKIVQYRNFSLIGTYRTVIMKDIITHYGTLSDYPMPCRLSRINVWLAKLAMDRYFYCVIDKYRRITEFIWFQCGYASIILSTRWKILLFIPWLPRRAFKLKEKPTAPQKKNIQHFKHEFKKKF